MSDRRARALAAHHVTALFDLVGHSLGGAVALTLAAHRPTVPFRLAADILAARPDAELEVLD